MSETTANSAPADPFELAEPVPLEAAEPPISFEDGRAPRPLNYYNYFSEIEDEFVKRRGSHLYLSSLDWALIQTWKDSGVPLHIVLRGINLSFDAYDKRPVKTRKVNSLFYCLQEVETCYADYRESQVGAAAEPAGADGTAQPAAGAQTEEFSKQQVLEFLAAGYEGLKSARRAASTTDNATLTEALGRALARLAELVREIQQGARLDCEGLERDLTGIEDLVLQQLLQSVPVDARGAVEQEGKTQLKSYKKKMPKEVYEQTLANYVAKRLRELHGIPRLSLFYL